MAHPLPFNERHRLEVARLCCSFDGVALQQGQTGDHGATASIQRDIDALVDLARHRFDAPIAFVSVQNEDQQIFLSRAGSLPEATRRADAICAHALVEGTVFCVGDLSRDPRFADNPYVAGPPHLRFYAGAPITLPGGFHVGTLCVCDTGPRDVPDEVALQALQTLAGLIADKMQAASGAPLSDIRQESKREFLALMSHECRTPLNAIIGFCEMIEMVGRQEAVREYAGHALGSARHLLSLIDRILTFSHLEEGAVTLRERAIDPAELLRDMVAQAVESQTGGPALTLDIAPALPKLVCDPDHVSAMVLSLLNNAMDAARSAVIVRACRSECGDFILTVADDGDGLAGADPDRILNPFSVGEDVYSRRGGGIGLGLPLSQRIARLHGGDLTITDGTPLPGLCARVVLPRRRLGAPAGVQESDDDRSGSTELGRGRPGSQRRSTASPASAAAALG